MTDARARSSRLPETTDLDAPCRRAGVSATRPASGASAQFCPGERARGRAACPTRRGLGGKAGCGAGISVSLIHLSAFAGALFFRVVPCCVDIGAIVCSPTRLLLSPAAADGSRRHSIPAPQKGKPSVGRWGRRRCRGLACPRASGWPCLGILAMAEGRGCPDAWTPLAAA